MPFILSRVPLSLVAVLVFFLGSATTRADDAPRIPEVPSDTTIEAFEDAACFCERAVLLPATAFNAATGAVVDDTWKSEAIQSAPADDLLQLYIDKHSDAGGRKLCTQFSASSLRLRETESDWRYRTSDTAQRGASYNGCHQRLEYQFSFPEAVLQGSCRAELNYCIAHELEMRSNSVVKVPASTEAAAELVREARSRAAMAAESWAQTSEIFSEESCGAAAAAHAKAPAARTFDEKRMLDAVLSMFGSDGRRGYLDECARFEGYRPRLTKRLADAVDLVVQLGAREVEMLTAESDAALRDAHYGDVVWGPDGWRTRAGAAILGPRVRDVVVPVGSRAPDGRAWETMKLLEARGLLLAVHNGAGRAAPVSAQTLSARAAVGRSAAAATREEQRVLRAVIAELRDVDAHARATTWESFLRNGDALSQADEDATLARLRTTRELVRAALVLGADLDAGFDASLFATDWLPASEPWPALSTVRIAVLRPRGAPLIDGAFGAQHPESFLDVTTPWITRTIIDASKQVATDFGGDYYGAPLESLPALGVREQLHRLRVMLLRSGKPVSVPGAFHTDAGRATSIDSAFGKMLSSIEGYVGDAWLELDTNEGNMLCETRTFLGSSALRARAIGPGPLARAIAMPAGIATDVDGLFAARAEPLSVDARSVHLDAFANGRDVVIGLERLRGDALVGLTPNPLSGPRPFPPFPAPGRIPVLPRFPNFPVRIPPNIVLPPRLAEGLCLDAEWRMASRSKPKLRLYFAEGADARWRDAELLAVATQEAARCWALPSASSARCGDATSIDLDDATAVAALTLPGRQHFVREADLTVSGTLYIVRRGAEGRVGEVIANVDTSSGAQVRPLGGTVATQVEELFERDPQMPAEPMWTSLGVLTHRVPALESPASDNHDAFDDRWRYLVGQARNAIERLVTVDLEQVRNAELEAMRNDINDRARREAEQQDMETQVADLCGSGGAAACKVETVMTPLRDVIDVPEVASPGELDGKTCAEVEKALNDTVVELSTRIQGSVPSESELQQELQRPLKFVLDCAAYSVSTVFRTTEVELPVVLVRAMDDGPNPAPYLRRVVGVGKITDAMIVIAGRLLTLQISLRKMQETHDEMVMRLEGVTATLAQLTTDDWEYALCLTLAITAAVAAVAGGVAAVAVAWPVGVAAAPIIAVVGTSVGSAAAATTGVMGMFNGFIKCEESNTQAIAGLRAAMADTMAASNAMRTTLDELTLAQPAFVSTLNELSRAERLSQAAARMFEVKLELLRSDAIADMPEWVAEQRTEKQRFLSSLARARYLAFDARRAVEFRFAENLPYMTDKKEGGRAPSEWASWLFLLHTQTLQGSGGRDVRQFPELLEAYVDNHSQLSRLSGATYALEEEQYELVDLMQVLQAPHEVTSSFLAGARALVRCGNGTEQPWVPGADEAATLCDEAGGVKSLRIAFSVDPSALHPDRINQRIRRVLVGVDAPLPDCPRCSRRDVTAELRRFPVASLESVDGLFTVFDAGHSLTSREVPLITDLERPDDETQLARVLPILNVHGSSALKGMPIKGDYQLTITPTRGFPLDLRQTTQARVLFQFDGWHRTGLAP